MSSSTKYLFLALTLAGLASSSAKEAERFVGLAQKDGRWWLQAPSGARFLAFGVNSVQSRTPRPELPPGSPVESATAGDEESGIEAAKEVATRLRGWGFNTLGHGSDPALVKALGDKKSFYYTLDLSFTERPTGPDPRLGLRKLCPDVFSADFAEQCRASALKQCASKKADPFLIGYFLESEFPWEAGKETKEELLITFLRTRPGSAGRQAAVDLLRAHYGSIERLNEFWGRQFKSWNDLLEGSLEGNPLIEAQTARRRPTNHKAEPEQIKEDCLAFKKAVAERYFKATAQAIRRADPHHLILGMRFDRSPGSEILNAMQEHVDVLSISVHRAEPEGALVEYSGWKKPVLISDFSFHPLAPAPKESSTPEILQQRRAEAFDQFAGSVLKSPSVIGLLWVGWTPTPVAKAETESAIKESAVKPDDTQNPLATAMQGFGKQAASGSSKN